MAVSPSPRDVHDRLAKRAFGRKRAFAVELRRVLPGELLAHVDLRTLAKHSTERTNEHLRGRLRIGGFTNYGEGEDTQRCEECIHYHSNRRWCDLPELPMPVDAHWWCRLWKS